MIDEVNEIWTNEDKFNATLKNVGLKDNECHTIYSYLSFPSTSALYMSLDKSQWISFIEAFAFFIIRSLFIYEQWIEPNESLSNQKVWDKNNYDWLYKIDFMYPVFRGTKIVNSVIPHKFNAHDVKSKSDVWFRLCNTSKQDIDFIINKVINANFISLYDDSYTYDQLFFGETENEYIFIQLQLFE